MSSTPSALCFALLYSDLLFLSAPLSSLYLIRYLSPLFPPPLSSSDCSGLHLHINICCISALQLHCTCCSFQVFHHSLRTVTIVFCWGEFALHLFSC